MDSATLAQQLSDYDKNKVTSTDALNSALTQYGVPEIRNTVSGLRTTLANTQNAYNAVDPSVTGRTQGSLVTEAQRSRQVANERAPIAGQISDQSKALGQNQQDLTDALGQAQTQATNKVNDYNAGRAALESQYTNAYTREQAASDLAEKQRESNLAAQNATDVAHITYGNNGGAPNTPAAPSAPQVFSQQRQGGGFNFQDAGGKAISAGAYAAASGTPISDLLYKMGQSGDKYAAQAYNQIKGNLDYYNKNPNVLKSEFAPIFWGT